MKFFTIFICFIMYCFSVLADASISIATLRQSNGNNPYLQSEVVVEGVVTGVFQQSNQIGGFFIQDEKGIFVEHTTKKVSIGDSVRITATLTSNNNRLQLTNVSALDIVNSNNQIPITKLIFPDDFDSLEAWEGALVELDQTMYVTNNYNLFRYGQLTLSANRLYIPTHQALPLSDVYFQTISSNEINQLILDDASSVSYPTNKPFTDSNGTRRMGEKIDNLQVIIDQVGTNYVVYAPKDIDFYGNPRTATHPSIGDYSIKVCGTNLEMFKTSYWGDGFGADNSTEFARQRTKILAALHAINADIYAITEIQQGSNALENLVNGLNALRGNTDFTYINDKDNVSEYIKSAFIYNKNKVTPHLNVINNNTISSTRFRKKAQAFIENSSKEKFIVVVNHYKAKSGCPSSGADADKQDGQGCYNATRTQEAVQSLTFINYMINYAKDTDVLFLGDLNSYKYEDPITTLRNGGLEDLLEHFQGNDAYSYVYGGKAGYLDYALANSSMLRQATGASPWHLNSDEPSQLSYDNATYYQPNMYRYSDHDPIVVGLKLTPQAPFEPLDKIQLFHDLTSKHIIVTRAKNHQVSIIGIDGRFAHFHSIESDTETINTNMLPAGVYVVKITGTKEETFKFIQL